MQKTCTACGTSFTVSPEDLSFLEKVAPTIGGKKHSIPPPTHCPDCRQRRRLSWRNERRLYHRKCDLTEQDIISVYSPDKPHTVYSPEAWNSDQWDALSYGKEFDFNRPFFEQFRELQERVPRIGLHVVSNENSPYINLSGYNKNCHLIFAAEYDEDCLYGTQVIKSRSCVDTLNCYESEGCYELVDCEKGYDLLWSRDSSACKSSAFLYDCKGCTDCLFSTNLRNKTYCVFNIQLSREDYEAKKKEFFQRLQSGELPLIMREYEAFVQKQPHRDRIVLNCENVDGDYLQNSRNLRHCFDLSYAEDCAYVYTGFQVKDLMDVCHTTEAQIGYEGMSLGYGAYGSFFTHGSWSSRNAYYCDVVQSCSDCFGCVCLRQKKYCIFNKQYTQEQYEEFVPRIIEHMKKAGEWGEFFPLTLSPFSYNETLAQEYYPLTEEDILAKGWTWRAPEEAPKAAKTIPAAQLPTAIDAIPDDVLQWAIQCEATQVPFKLTKQELAFYREKNIPVPRLHPEERHRRRMLSRNPRKLWTRSCRTCGQTIETTYSPERPEKLLCESCYAKTVY